MLPDSILPTPEDDIARILRDYERRLTHLETLEGGGAWTLIEDSLLTAPAANIDFQNIPSRFKHLAIICYLRSDIVAVADALVMTFNNDGGNNYDWLLTTGLHPNTFLTAVGIADTNIQIGVFAGGTAPANVFDMSVIYVADYANVVGHKVARQNGTRKTANSAGGINVDQHSGWWRNTAAITRIILASGPGNNFDTGSRISLYGIN